MLHRLPFLILIVLITGTMISARADSVVFNNRADFNAATTGNVTITFNGIAGPGSFVFLGNPGFFTSNGVVFTTPAGNTSTFINNLFVVDQGFGNGFNTGSASAGGVLSSQYVAFNPNFLPNTPVINITLPGLVTAIGFDTNTFISTNVTVTLSNGEVLSFSTTDLNGGFFGFITNTPITSLQLSAPHLNLTTAGVINIDDFTFGQANQVPEPTTMLLLGTGLAGVGVGVWRKRREGRSKSLASFARKVCF